MYTARPKNDNSIYPYKNQHAIGILLFYWPEDDHLVVKTCSRVIIRKNLINS